MIGALPLVCAAFVLGIALAAKLTPALIFLVLSGLAAAVTSVVFTVKKKSATAVLLFLFFVLGMVVHQLADISLHTSWQPYFGQEVTVDGFVQKVLKSDGDYLAFLLRAEKPARGVVRVSLYRPRSDLTLSYGERLQIKGILTSPPGQRNPGGFDYASYLETTGVGALLAVSGEKVTVLPGRGGSLLQYGADRLRERAGQVLRQFLPAEEAGLSLALLFGDRQAVFPETLEAYRRLGIAHLLVVSGLHVGYVAAFALFLTGWLLRRRYTFLSAAAAGTVVLGYVLLTGGQPPVWRAGLTLFLVMFARQTGRESEGLQALLVAMLLLLYIRPLWLFSISFQFSFLATAGILVLTPRLAPYFCRLPKPVAGLLAVTLGAQLAVLPLQVTYFGVFSFLSVPLNLTCVPLVGLVMALCLAGTLVGLIYLPLAGPFLWAALPLLVFLERVPRIPANWPLAAVRLPMIHPFVWLVYLLALLYFARGLGVGTLSGKKVLSILVILNILVYFSLPVTGRGLVRVTFLDVGQGMAVHIRTPSGGNLLIDAGGRAGFDTGERIILPYFRSAGVDSLDLVVLTHPHYDHYGGLRSVIAQTQVKGLVSNGDSEDSEMFQELEEVLDAAALSRYAVEEGYRIKFDGLILDVLSPPNPRFSLTGDDINNNSLIFRLAYKDFAVLITGDAEADVIDRLVRIRPEVVDTTLVQVPHHGSRGALSQEFFLASGARVAVIPVGKNMFGHPHPQTLEQLNENGLAIYRTDVHGAITIVSDGSGWNISTQVNGADSNRTE
jgi:competence protein ComEC